ncbi:hypothetical protein PIB30_012812 [Stylosanthes scabra]|uniref:Uncharacterized protein n=1 Tax=Stylosanthes scabra TaxID=79078 RepID=A0ABU6U7X1_9FABA|nr:hypothetical protein [Stylosanthes scabra]
MVDTGTTSSVRITQMQSQSSGQGIDELRRGQVHLKTIEDVWSLTESLLIRYEIEIVAYDDTATITLLLWDNEVVDLIGIKAQTLKEIMEGDKDGYPSVIDELFEKRLLFKITVESKNISGEAFVFRVMKICDDEDIVERYYPNDEALDNKSKNNPAETGGNNEVDFSENVISLQNDTDNHLYRSVTSIKAKTPTKLVADGNDIVTKGKKIGDDEGQLSTNKFSRKMPKKAKMQNLDGDY